MQSDEDIRKIKFDMKNVTSKYAIIKIQQNERSEHRPLLAETTDANGAWIIFDENQRHKTRALVIFLLGSLFDNFFC